MTDWEIVSLFFARDEKAIAEAREKYGAYIRSIAEGILHNKQDAEECENDTYLAAWNSMPPNNPTELGIYLGKLSRRIAINRWRHNSAAKRGGGQTALALEELDDCIPDKCADLSQIQLSGLLDSFLRSIPSTERNVFMRRYWFSDSVGDIAGRFGFSHGKVKMMLMRTRKKLQEYLLKGGYRV